MTIVLPTLPITDLPTKQPEVLNHLQTSPVVLTHHGHGAAVLVVTTLCGTLIWRSWEQTHA
jgi:hypothetical protein